MTIAIPFDPILANTVAASYHNLVTFICDGPVAMDALREST
jgi:hypothetical protein